MSEIYQIIIVALFAAFIILLLGKTGLRISLRDYSDKVGLSLIAEMLECDFCLSFWICLIILTFMGVTGHDYYIITIFCAPPITRFLI